jgi:hypothetical protein
LALKMFIDENGKELVSNLRKLFLILRHRLFHVQVLKGDIFIVFWVLEFKSH